MKHLNQLLQILSARGNSTSGKLFSSWRLQDHVLTSATRQCSVHQPPEDSIVLDFLLRFCYPIPDPDFDDLVHLGPVLEAAIKYDMDRSTCIAKRARREFIKDRPLPVYAISCFLHREEGAALVTSAWKAMQASWDDKSEDFSDTVTGLSFIPDMNRNSAASYFPLLDYLRGYDVLTFCSLQVDPDDEAKVTLENEEDSAITETVPEKNDSSDPESSSFEDLVSKYPFTLPDPDVIICSCDGAEFKVYRLILTIQIDSSFPIDIRPFMKDENVRADNILIVALQPSISLLIFAAKLQRISSNISSTPPTAAV